MNQVLHELGLYDQLKIKNWFKTYAQTEKYNYAKAFYWTFLNYFDSYRIAWSGVLNKDLHHAEDKN